MKAKFASLRDPYVTMKAKFASLPQTVNNCQK